MKPILKTRLKEIAPSLETYIATGKKVGEKGVLLDPTN